MKLICKETYNIEVSDRRFYPIEKDSVWKIIGECELGFIIQRVSNRSDVAILSREFAEEIFDFI